DRRAPPGAARAGAALARGAAAPARPARRARRGGAGRHPCRGTGDERMRRRRLGAAGPEVSEIGLGCMGMSGMYGPADRGESIATIHAALDAGITLIDTGDFYGMGHNELLIGEAVKAVPRDRLLVSVKFGALRDPAGGWSGVDGRPAA